MLEDGAVKVSLNFTEYAYIKSAYISFRPVRSTEAPYSFQKVLATFECRHVTREGVESAESPEEESLGAE